MGSQTLVTRKLNPNLCRGRTDSCQSSKTSKIVRRTTEAANKKVMSRTISSPSRRRLRNEREPEMGPAPGTVVVVVATLLNVVQRLGLFRDNLFGKLGVGESLGVVLAVVQH